MRFLAAGLLALCLSLPLARTAHAAPPKMATSKMSKSSSKSKPKSKMATKAMRDPKTGRFLPKTATASTKTMPMRDPKTGRFLPKGTSKAAMNAGKMGATKKMPMRDSKGHFIKGTAQTTHKM